MQLSIVAVVLALTCACTTAAFTGEKAKSRRDGAASGPGGDNVIPTGGGGQTTGDDAADGTADDVASDDTGDTDAVGGTDDQGDADSDTGDSDSDSDADGDDIGGDDGVVVEDEGTIISDEITGPHAVLTLTGLRKDDDVGPLTVVITKANGQTYTANWPEKAQAVDVAGVCNKPDVTIQITVNGRAPSNQKCFVGKRQDERSVIVGFEDDCDLADYNGIDDSIATYSCPQSNLEIVDLRLDSSIQMDQWLH
jgi:hypothetical protein